MPKMISVLHDHLNKPKAKNATYLSPRSQNEIISVIGYDIIQANIISEVKEAMFSQFLLMKSAVTMLSIYQSVFASLIKVLILEKSLLHL